MGKIKLLLPVRDVHVTQPFGVNFLDFYAKLNMKGHNGVDFRARRGCPVLASHAGVVTWAGKDGDGGIAVELWHSGWGIKTLYYHLLRVNDKIQRNVAVAEGDIIGYANNTGIYTTGDHLHFGLKFTDPDGNTLNRDNGYFGAVDPAPYFEAKHGKHWEEPAAYHRYGRRQEWLAEFNMRFKNVWLHRQLIRMGLLRRVYDTKFINALVYGGWDFEAAINPAMYELWAHLKKSEYLAGKRPFT